MILSINKLGKYLFLVLAVVSELIIFCPLLADIDAAAVDFCDQKKCSAQVKQVNNAINNASYCQNCCINGACEINSRKEKIAICVTAGTILIGGLVYGAKKYFCVDVPAIRVRADLTPDPNYVNPVVTVPGVCQICFEENIPLLQLHGNHFACRACLIDFVFTQYQNDRAAHLLSNTRNMHQCACPDLGCRRHLSLEDYCMITGGNRAIIAAYQESERFAAGKALS
jgi:hypothetical protein